MPRTLAVFHLENDHTLHMNGSDPGTQPTDALLVWLRDHDIDPERMPATGQKIVRGDTWIEVVEGAYDAEGRRMFVGDGEWPKRTVRHELGRAPAPFPAEVAEASMPPLHACPGCGAPHFVAGKEA